LPQRSKQQLQILQILATLVVISENVVSLNLRRGWEREMTLKKILHTELEKKLTGKQ
jgi:hypothetical protein